MTKQLHHPIETVERDQAYYRAVAAKDSRFDGVFFTGVKTTGIYCRPVCSAKTPRPSSCVFFDSAAAAEAAGFRPCLRCRPELAPYALQQNLAFGVWQKIVAGVLNDGSSEDLAVQVGLSSRQLRRVLFAQFGVTPVELAQTQRLLFAKKLLQETHLPMAELAYAAGFGSVRRFNALFEQRYKMTPGSIRRTAQEPDDGLVLRLAYRPPYAWDALLAYLKGRAMLGLEAVISSPSAAEGSAYVRSVQLDGKYGWIRVTHLPERCQLALQVAPSLSSVLMPLLARVRTQFDLEANPSVIQSHLASDPLLAAQMARTPGLRVPGAFDSFELAIRAVLGQQVSVAGATTVAGRLVQRFGTGINTPYVGVTHHFPSPALLAQIPIEDIAQIGLPKSRAATVQNLARFALAGGLQNQLGVSKDAMVTQLKTVTGIGEWTAQYIALRALRYPDAFPAGDLGLQKSVALAPDIRMTEKALQQRSQAWSPWRAYAALLLWQSLSKE